MTLKYIWRSFSLGCHFHVYFSYPWHAFASHGLPAIAELFVIAGDNIVDAISSYRHIVLRSQTSLPKSGSGSSQIWIPDCGYVWLWLDLNSQIRYKRKWQKWSCIVTRYGTKHLSNAIDYLRAVFGFCQGSDILYGVNNPQLITPSLPPSPWTHSCVRS